jgi:cyanophycinase
MFFSTSLAAQTWAASTGKELTIIAGGGDLALDATSLFVEASGGKNARLLVITWAAEADPKRSANFIQADLHRHELKSLDYSIHPPRTKAEAKQFLEQLKNSDGIFFSGGKQRRIMQALNEFPELRAEILSRYHGGMPVMGTSAGTAMQSAKMIGDGVKRPAMIPPIDRGLGLLPEDVILDTHFFPRSRWKRLVPLIEAYPGMMGIGVDENGAAVVRGEKTLQVLGHQNLMVVDGKKIYELRPGDLLDLNDRVPHYLNPSQFRQCLLYPLQLFLGK